MAVIKCFTSDYEVIDTKILHVINGEFKIQIDDIVFRFGFMDTKEIKGTKLAVDKDIDPVDGVYNIIIANFNNLDLGGFFEPMLLGNVNGTDYHFSLSGWAIKGKEYDAMIINILRKL